MKKENTLSTQKKCKQLFSFINSHLCYNIWQYRNKMLRFGELISLSDGQHFLDAVDNEEKGCTVIVLIHEPGVPGCEAMLQCLRCIARDYKSAKFCEIVGSAAGLSKHFNVSGVPAILGYRAGQLITNFVRLTDHFGEDFFANEVETFLLEHGLIVDKQDIPKIIRGQVEEEDADDED